MNGSSFAFSTLDISRHGIQLLHTDEPELFGLSVGDGAMTGASPPEAPAADGSPSKAAKRAAAAAERVQFKLVHALRETLAAPIASDPWAPEAEVEDAKMFGVLAKYRHVRFVDVSRNRLLDLTPICGMPSLLALSAAGNALAMLPHPHAQRRLRWLQNLDVSFNLLQRLDGLPPRRAALEAFFGARAAALAAAREASAAAKAVSDLAAEENGGDDDRKDGGDAGDGVIAADADAEALAAAAAAAHDAAGSPVHCSPDGASVGGLLLPWLRELLVSGNHLETLSGVGVGVGPLCESATVAPSEAAAAAASVGVDEAVPAAASGSACGCPRLARIEAVSNALGPSLAGIGYCPSLVELLVARNQLTSLGGLGGCPAVQLLVASRNAIGSLRALADPCDPAHRREWGWAAIGGSGAGGNGAEEEEEEDEAMGASAAGGAGEDGEADPALLDEEAWAARTARRRTAAAAEEEAKEDFGLPDDRSVARMLAVGAGLPRDVAAAGAALATGEPVRLLSGAQVDGMPLASLVDIRSRLLAISTRALAEAASLTDSSMYEPPESLSIPSAAATDADVADDDSIAAGSRKVVLPASPGAGFAPRGADAATLERACRAVLASIGAARDAIRVGVGAAEAASASSPETEAATLTEPESYATALALVGPAVSPLVSLERLDLRHNSALTALRELVWLRCLPRLRALDLRGCPVSDEGEGMPTEALIRVGLHLTEVNGVTVTDVQRRAAVRERLRRVKERAAWRREQAGVYAESVREATATRKEALEAAADAAAALADEEEEA